MKGKKIQNCKEVKVRVSTNTNQQVLPALCLEGPTHTTHVWVLCSVDLCLQLDKLRGKAAALLCDAEPGPCTRTLMLPRVSQASLLNSCFCSAAAPFAGAVRGSKFDLLKRLKFISDCAVCTAQNGFWDHPHSEKNTFLDFPGSRLYQQPSTRASTLALWTTPHTGATSPEHHVPLMWSLFLSPDVWDTMDSNPWEEADLAVVHCWSSCW